MMFGKNKGAALTAERIPFCSVGVEIGVWRGDSSEWFLRRGGYLHLVDPWSVEPYETSNEFGDYAAYLNRYAKLVGSNNPEAFQSFYDGIYRSVEKRFRDCPVTIHRQTSAEFFAEFRTTVDWVYVDGLHSFDGCLTDLIGALNIVKQGGSIFGDDYGNKEGVTGAVDGFVEHSGLYVDHFENQYQIRV